ncbi:MAG TPA: hypothetical protein DCL29_00240 [Eubacterium sp.]|nr:hypothetical protein [Eubacterium sp.]
MNISEIATIMRYIHIMSGFALILFGIYILYNKIIYPLLVVKTTIDVEKNPKWIVSKLQENYYGFKDMDIILVDSPFGLLPRFRIDKQKNNKLQLLVSKDISTYDIENIACIALAGKIRIKYGLWFPDKPAHWLSVLNFMLDGGEIRVKEMTWEDKTKNQPNRQETN